MICALMHISMGAVPEKFRGGHSLSAFLKNAWDLKTLNGRSVPCWQLGQDALKYQTRSQVPVRSCW
jgi:hypothetical protein